MKKISCHKCKHYKVTWEIHFHYACRAFNFKSQKTPSLVVYESSGEDCKLFSPKPPKKRPVNNLDLWDFQN